MKAFVDATPISGPAFVGKTQVDSRAIELCSTLTIARIFLVCILANLKAPIVSAVSPDWLTKTSKSSLLITGDLYLNSDASSA